MYTDTEALKTTGNLKNKIKNKNKKRISRLGSGNARLAGSATVSLMSRFHIPPILPYCYCYISMSKVGDMSRRYR